MAIPLRRGLTVIELLAVLLVVGIIVAVLAPLVMPGRSKGYTRTIRDSTQVRGIHQGMLLWSQNNGDRYPRPSVADAAGFTMAGEAAAKDTMANMLSMLIFEGFFSPELCISTSEVNPAITTFGSYQYTAPSGTVDPERARWDPAFSVDFTSPKGGSCSYALALPFGDRAHGWMVSGSASTAIIGNRGPLVASVAKGTSPSVGITTAIATSNTLLIHGARKTWEGNICFDDGHANFETRLDPEDAVYRDAAGKSWQDVLFYDEADDPAWTNNFLGIWVTAGATREAWTSIWD